MRVLVDKFGIETVEEVHSGCIKSGNKIIISTYNNIGYTVEMRNSNEANTALYNLLEKGYADLSLGKFYPY